MDLKKLNQIVIDIVDKTQVMVKESTNSWPMSVSWCCIFCQDDDEFKHLSEAALKYGTLAKQTHNGPIVILPAIKTSGGTLRIVKIRQPDTTRPERGDADFAVDDYAKFKETHLSKDGFTLIQKPEFEMLELMQPGAQTRAYFSNPPVEEHEGIKEALEQTIIDFTEVGPNGVSAVDVLETLHKMNEE